MEKITLKKHEARIFRVYFDEENFVEIYGESAGQWHNFSVGMKRLEELSAETAKKIDEIEKKYKGKEDSGSVIAMNSESDQISYDSSKEAIGIAESVWGKGACEKRFADSYEHIPNFIPYVDMILDFFKELMPYMEEYHMKLMDERKKDREKAMEKYKPMDFEDPAKSE